MKPLNRWLVAAASSVTFYLGWIVYLWTCCADHQYHSDIPLFALVGIVQGPLYFLPTIIGLHKHNVRAIFLLNAMLGVTGIGWIGALIWSVLKEERQISA